MKKYFLFLLALLIGLGIAAFFWQQNGQQHIADTSSIVAKSVILPDGKESGYTLDNKNVYYLGSSYQTQGDPATFKLIGSSGYFGRDKDHVYAFGQWIEGADLVTFTDMSYPGGISEVFMKDKNHVYTCSFDAVPSCDTLAGFDPATFTVLDQYGAGMQAPTYAKDKNHVYWGVNEILGADPATFKVVVVSDPPYYDAQDKNQKYYNGGIAK